MVSPRLHLALAAALALAFIACRPGPVSPGARAAQAWVDQSNAHAKLLLDEMARHAPESAASLGIESVDEEIMDLRPGFVERRLAAGEEVLAKMRARLRAEQNPRVREDLQILVQTIEDNLQATRLEEAKLLSHINLVQAIFYGSRSLLNEQIPPARRAKVVTRLRRYAGLEKGYAPITELAQAYLRQRLQVTGLVPPPRAEVEKDLATSPALIEGLGGLCKRFAVPGCDEAYQALRPQLVAYDEFLRKELLPRTRTDFRLPPEIYAQRLRHQGVDIPPAELAALARKTFVELQAQMNTVAAKVQAGATNYRAVIRGLKEKQLVGEAILPHYKQRIRDLEAIVRAQALVSLPRRPARVRLASAAESAGLPAPNMRPPRLLGNQGERGTFVLPLQVPPPPGQDPAKALKLDDFTFEAASWTLTAHEARPGHEMQFAAVIEAGVSIARAVFAFNSTNVEGWGLYAEHIVFPFLPPEGQLISLQHRLMRAARAYLDPELQAGTMTPEEALRILREDVVLSEGMARQEVERYTFRAPGQATTYFYGYTRLLAVRQEVEALLGQRFKAQPFHDHLLSLGLLPPKLQREAMLRWAQGQSGAAAANR